MKFDEIITRITGISTPVFGISWNPPEAQRTIAQRVINYLEDKRVLYNPYQLEVPEYCVESVIHIREFLTTEISKLDASSDISKNLRAMRAACRKFMDTMDYRSPDVIKYGFTRNHWASWIFLSALGELRGVFGIHLALIATKYGLDIENELAKIIPDEDPID